MPEELYNLIYNKALDLISRREHSLKEIKDKLRLRYNEADTVEEVVDKLISNNLVNNLRFTEFYVISRKRKGFGPKKNIL
jgi:regulatory protein